MSKAALRASLTLWRRRHAYRQRKLDYYHQVNDTVGVAKWHRLLEQAGEKIRLRERQLAAADPVRVKAFRVAESLVGVMEHGGNNAGPMVSRIIRENGGGGPEPWCGDFVAYCYRHAGSKRVQRAWASVRALRGLLGITATSSPRRGDLVRFTFDHVGLFDRDNGDGTITTIEGNTGASGAVSDSSTGGDGVYRKRRSKQLVRDYLRVLG